MIVSIPHIEGGSKVLLLNRTYTTWTATLFRSPTFWNSFARGARRAFLALSLACGADVSSNALLTASISRLCSRRWAEAEPAYLSNAHSESGLRQLERLFGESPGFAVVLRRDYPKIDGAY